jgi:alpha-amylase/alpha-mannosidase (GH57 family)
MVKPQPFEIFGHSGLTPSLFKKYDMSYHTVFMYFSKTEWLGFAEFTGCFCRLDDA